MKKIQKKLFTLLLLAVSVLCFSVFAVNTAVTTRADVAYTYSADIAVPTASHKSGVYSGRQTVTLTGADGTTVYYTTDGTFPNPNNTSSTQVYSSPISIGSNAATSNHSIRAVAVIGTEMSASLDVDITIVAKEGTGKKENLAKGLTPQFSNGEAKSDSAWKDASAIKSSASPADVGVITDGSLSTGTFWGNSSDYWMLLDLGGLYYIDEIRFSTYTGTSKYLIVDVSTEKSYFYNDTVAYVSGGSIAFGTTTHGFSRVVDRSGATTVNAGTMESFKLQSPLLVRYIRFHNTVEFTYGSTPVSLSCFTEFQVLKSASTNVAYGKTPTVTSVSSGSAVEYSCNGHSVAATTTTDGDMMTSTDYSTYGYTYLQTDQKAWLTIDFGANYTISRLATVLALNLQFYITVQFSTDGSNWVTEVDNALVTNPSPNGFINYEVPSPKTARYIRMSSSCTLNSEMSCFGELQAWAIGTATDIISDTTNWAAVYSNVYTNDGSVITSSSAGNWQAAYSYNARKYEQYVLEGQFTLKTMGSGLFGFGIFRGKTEYFNDGGTGVRIFINPNNNTLQILQGTTPLVDVSVSSKIDFSSNLNKSLPFILLVDRGRISLSVNGKVLVDYYNSAFVGKNGYISLCTGNMVMEFSDIYATMIAPALVNKQATVVSAEIKTGVPLGTAEGEVISNYLGSTVSATASDGKNYTINVANWQVVDYDSSVSAYYSFSADFVASSLSDKGIVNVYNVKPSASVYVKSGTEDKTYLNRHITNAKYLKQDYYNSDHWNSLQNAIAAAEVINNDTTGYYNQAAIDTAANNLVTRLNAMVFTGDATGVGGMHKGTISSVGSNFEYQNVILNGSLYNVFTESFITSDNNASNRLVYDKDLGYALKVTAANSSSGFPLSFESLSINKVYHITTDLKVFEAGSATPSTIKSFLLNWWTGSSGTDCWWYGLDETSGTVKYKSQHDYRDTAVYNSETGVYTLSVYVKPTTATARLRFYLNAAVDALGVAAQDYLIGSVYVSETDYTWTPAKSTVTTLDSLSIDGSVNVTGFTFNKDTTSYNIRTSRALETTDISYVKGDVGQTVAVTKSGSTISVKVTAEDTTKTKTYTLNYTVMESDNTLSDIKYNGEMLEGFVASTTTYEFAVESLPTESAITYTVNSTRATAVKSFGMTGSSRAEFAITVTAENGDAQVYRVIYLRTYTLSFNHTTGEGEMAPIVLAYSKSTTLPANTFTKVGGAFESWNTAADGSGTTYNNLAEFTMGGADVTLYARWTLAVYTLTYNLNGGTVDVANPENYNIDSETFTLNNPHREFYTFAGWLLNEETTPVITVTIVTGSYGDRTYTATWTPVEYTIAYNLNGGTVKGEQQNPVKYNVETETFTLINPEKDGYAFIGWTGSNGDNPQAYVSIDVGSTGNKNYTANWEIANYTISYELNGGAVATPNPTNYTIESETITLNNPTKNGYTFAGWLLNDETTPVINVTIAQGSFGNRTYTATWTPVEYTIEYNLDGGAVATDNPTVYTIETATFTLVNPERGGYAFLGWTGSNGETPETSVTITVGTTGNKTYTANWELTSYTISYDLAGGTVVGTNPVEFNYFTDTFTLINPTKDGFKFVGWTGTGLSDKTMTVTIEKNSFGDREYTANWASKDATLATIRFSNVQVSGFSKDVLEYNMIVDTIELIPTLGDASYVTTEEHATVVAALTGKVFTFTVTAEDKETVLVYTVTYREKSTENRLASIEICGVLLEGFNSDVFAYTVTVTNESDIPEGNKTNFVCTPIDAEFATYTVSKVGREVTISVQSESGAEQNYVITYRIKSTDATLKSLTAKGLTSFSPAIGDYGTIRLSSSDTVPEISDISYEVNEEHATAVINRTVNAGITTFTITVTAENTEHTFTYTWSYRVESSDATIKSVKVGGEDFVTIEVGVYEYETTLDIADMPASSQVVVETNDAAASAEVERTGIGTFVYTITVVAEDETQLVYTITVKAYYKIVFNANDGSGSMEDLRVLTGGTVKLTKNVFTRTGYTFQGWALSATSSTVNYADEANVTVTSSNVNLYAVWQAISYNIAYNLAGGSLAEENPANYTIESVIELNNPTKEGYAFLGWTGSNGDTPETSVVISGLTGDLSYTANWQILSHTVTIHYIYADESKAYDDYVDTVDYGEMYNVESPAITGYTPDKATVSGTVTTSDVVVTVTYSVNSYQLTINYKYAGGATASETHSEYVNYGADYEVESPVITGYTPDKATVSGVMGAANVEVTVTYTAENYTISYNLNGGVVSEENPTNYTIESDNIVLNNPTKDGYTFLGWTGTGIDTPEKEVTIASGSTGNRSYVANWAAQDAKLYSIKVKGEEISGFDKDVTEYNFVVTLESEIPAVSDITYTAGENATVNVVKEGRVITLTVFAEDSAFISEYVITYRVKSTDATLSSIKVSGADLEGFNSSTYVYGPFMLTVDDVVPAKDDVVCVTTDANAEYEIERSVSGKVTTFTVTVTAENTDYTLTYTWSYRVLSDDATIASVKVSGVDFITVVESQTEYVVYVDSNGDVPKASDIVVTTTDANAIVADVSRTNVSRSYTFTIDILAEDGVTEIVYTIVCRVNFKVIFNANGGTGEMADLVIPSTETKALTANAFVKEGYSFRGWSKTAGGSVAYVNGANCTLTTANMNLYAVWGVEQFTLTVNYLYEDSTVAAEAFVQDYDADSPYHVESPAIIGYTPDKAVVEGVMGATPIIVNVVYSINSYTLTIHYKDTNGSKILDDYVAQVEYNAEYNVVSPAVENATPDVAKVSGVMGAENKEVTVTYIPNSRSLTVHYRYENGAKAAEDSVGVYNYGEAYNVASPVIEGYTPDIATVSGTMDTVNVEVTVTYTINKYTLTVTYVYAAGGTAAPANVSSVNYGSEYSVVSPVITGYTADKLIVSGTMATANVAVTVTYAVNAYTLTIKYLDTESQAVAESYEANLNYGAEYDVLSPVLDGYDVDTVKVSGIMAAENKEVTVTYTARSYNLTVVYVYENTVKAWEDYTATVKYGAAYNVESPVITGYTADKLTVSGNIGAADVKVTVTYTVNAYELTVKYVYVNESSASGDYVAAVNYGADYSVVSPSIKGYKASVNKVEGVMGAENKEVTVIYTVINYTLSYDLDGGTVTDGNPANYNVATATFTLNNPEKEGYDFVGWTGTGIDAVETEVTVNKGSVGNREYFAVWSEIEYSVEYDLAGGTVVSENPEIYTVESEDFTLNNPTRKGYVFIGWTGSNGDEQELEVTVEAGSIGDKSYTANWKVITYAISYDLGGGVLIDDNPANYNVATSTFTLNNPVMTGYTFLGWSGTGIDGRSLEVTVTAGSIGEREYQAVWSAIEYTVSYTLNGGTVDGENVETYYVYNGDVEIINPVKMGYTFLGWSGTGIDEYETQLVITAGSIGDREYVANWKVNAYTLTVKYVYAGGAKAADDYVANVNYGAAYNVESPAITGYTPDAATVSGNMAAENKEVTVTYNVNAYALTVKYVYAGGAKAADDYVANVNYRAEYSVVSPVITGYTADKLTVSGTMAAEKKEVTVTYAVNAYTLTIKYLDTESQAVAESYVANVNYGAEYSVVSPVLNGYDADTVKVSGTMAAENKEVTVTYTARSYKLTIVYLHEGEEVGKAVYTLPFKAEYNFVSPAVVGYTPDKAAISGTMGAADVNEEVTYSANAAVITVNYVYADGTAAAQSKIINTYYDEGFEIASPEIAGYVADQPVVIGTVDGDSIIVNVIYTEKNYTITYTLDGGTVDGNPATYTVKDKVVVINPVKDDYVFIGWSGTGIDGKTLELVIEKGSVGNREYVANFVSSEASLADITVNGAEIFGFAADTYEYSFKVDAIPSVNSVLATAVSDAAEITVVRENNNIIITVTAEDGETVKEYVLAYQLTSGEAYVTGVSIFGEEIEDFDKDEKDYEIELAETPAKADVEITVSDNATYTVAVDEIGENTVITVVVTSENGVNEETYTVTVSLIKSDNNFATVIAIKGEEIEDFDKEEGNYEIDVYSELDVPEADEVEVYLEDGTAEYEVSVEDNVVTVTVIAEDGSEREYVITYNVTEVADAAIESVIIAGEEIEDFDPDQSDYEIAVHSASEIPEIEDFAIAASDEDATVNIEKDGSMFVIVVTSLNGTSKEYTVSYVIVLSNNAKLKDIKISGVTISGFDRDKTEYEVTVSGSITTDDVTVATANSGATAKIAMSGDVITITVTAEDGKTVKTYKLTLKGGKSVNPPAGENLFGCGANLVGNVSLAIFLAIVVAAFITVRAIKSRKQR